MPGYFSFQELLSRARRREIFQLVLDQSALALTLAMGGAVLLLLVGTEILNWYWLLLLAGGSLAVGLWRLRKTIPSLYSLAQRIDRRLGLADALSTAFYFSEHPDPARQAVCERQRDSANQTAGGVDLRAALPYRRSRFAIPAVALAVAAFALFGLRYLVLGTMDLQPSLVQVAYDSFFSTKTNEAENHAKRLRPNYIPSDANDSNAKLDEQEEKDLNPADNPDASPSETNDSKDPGKDQQDKGSQKGDNKSGDKGTNQDASNQNPADSKDGNNADQKNGDKGNQDAKSGTTPNSSSSMMDKIKDALNNMLSKMKPNDSQQQNQNDSGAQEGKKSNPSDKGQKSSQQGKDKEKADNSSSQAEGDQTDQGDNADATDSKKSSDKASADAKSGAGSQDGEKALRLAAELKAMGKITEVLGKRSQNVTGEVMMEVGNGKQPLKTQFSQREATHVDAGGEVHRDEIPLADQEFVQQYFEEIRKPSGPAPKTPAKPADKPAAK